MTFHVNILTLFPEIFPGFLGHGLSGKALAAGLWSYKTVNIRDFATDRHRSVDDTPYGGGAGMVLRPDVIERALLALSPVGRGLGKGQRNVGKGQIKNEPQTEDIFSGKAAPEKTMQRACSLRTDQTEAEKKLWFHLKNRQLAGFKFRRQHEMHPFIVDFACPEARLIVELDGGQHADQADYDSERTAFLEAQGYRVLRFWNNEVLENIEGVLETILQRLSSWGSLSPFICPSPNPLPTGERAIYLSPRGKPLTQDLVREFSETPELTLLCGRYEGVDQRVLDACAFEEISIGDYVLSGGEQAALILMDACIRLLPGVMGNSETPNEESFAQGLLEYPHYTRPAAWTDASGSVHKVPEVLLSGHHADITKWRREQAERLTRERRPDILASERE